MELDWVVFQKRKQTNKQTNPQDYKLSMRTFVKNEYGLY